MAAQPLAPSENWDDDFEFSQSNSNTNSKSKTKDSRKHDSPIDPPLEPRLSVTSSHFSEDWDAEDRPSPPRNVQVTRSSSAEGTSGIHSRLENWAEPGPSTPTKRLGVQAQAENWDDDFEDKADSPPGRRHPPHPGTHYLLQHNHHALRTRHSYHTPPRPKHSAEPENWDDDFDDPMDPGSSTSPSKIDNDNTPVTKRTRREAYADSSDEDDEFGFSEDKEEDKTVTARSRSALMLRGGSSTPNSHPSSHSSPPPPVPPLPPALSSSPVPPFPRSPTTSVFSIPTTSGRNSVGYFNSTSHLVLSGAGSSLPMGPPSPPHRERRRLRKKSRPPHMDNNVFELIEEHRDVTPPPLPPSTPERDRASSPSMVPMTSSSSVEATPGNSNKTPLLSRIGSVKKWGVRRKRASTGPAEVMMHELGGGGIAEEEGSSRPPSSLAHTQIQPQIQTPSSRNRNSNWFFRPGGALSGAGSPPPGQAAELKHEKSLDQARLRPGVGNGSSGEVPTTPSKSGKTTRRKASGIALEATSSSEFTGEGSSSASGLNKPSLGPSRRPTSMQVPHGAGLTITGGGAKFGSMGTRHASYGSSVGRASASRVFSTPTPTESIEDLPPMPLIPPQEGSRSFMGSVRKISLVGGKKHKKKKSSIEAAYIPPTPPPLPATSVQEQERSESRAQDLDGDTKMQTPSQSPTPDLLPPIELQPPSPPRTINGVSASRSMPLHIPEGHESMIPSTSAPASVSMSPRSVGVPATPSSATANKPTPKSPGSPQSASLGRTTQAPNPPVSNAAVPRRNSLGDLKIPARISQAQIGLKRDLGMVREFAASVDRLKELQSTYHHLLVEVQTILESAPPSRATSPSPTPNVFNLVRPRSRLRSNTGPPTNTSSNPSLFAEHKQLATSLHTIVVKYKISWECAELLIELGGGTPTPASPPVSGGLPGSSSSASSPAVSMQAELDRRKNRERAVTLSGEESKPPPVSFINSGTTASSSTGPPNASWRASTGRHDLSQRQLVLLRDMLNSGELPPDEMVLLPEDSALPVNRNWRWGDAMSSTVTLPSEESGSRGADTGENTGKKKRGGRMGMSGLRDMLRMLKRSHSEQVAPPVPALPVVPSSTASLSTESSLGSQHQHYYPHHHSEAGAAGGRRRSKTSTGPESVRSTRDVPANSPYGGPSLNHKASPRRPSLASIFRLGQKNKGGASSSAGESSQDSRSDVRSASRGSNMTGEEEDWDRIDSAIDLDSAAKALGIEGTATIKGRRGRSSPFLSEHPPVPVPGVPLPQQRPVTPRRGQEVTQALKVEVEASPRSIRPMRSTRLSNVEEVEDGDRQPRSETKGKNRASIPKISPHRPPSGKTGSVRSAPPQPLEDPHALPEIKLSMTPENIKPLLENAKEVHARCYECLRELRALLDAMPPGAQAAMSPPTAN